MSMGFLQNLMTVVWRGDGFKALKQMIFDTNWGS